MRSKVIDYIKYEKLKKNIAGKRIKPKNTYLKLHCFLKKNSFSGYSKIYIRCMHVFNVFT